MGADLSEAAVLLGGGRRAGVLLAQVIHTGAKSGDLTLKTQPLAFAVAQRGLQAGHSLLHLLAPLLICEGIASSKPADHSKGGTCNVLTRALRRC